MLYSLLHGRDDLMGGGYSVVICSAGVRIVYVGLCHDTVHLHDLMAGEHVELAKILCRNLNQKLHRI